MKNVERHASRGSLLTAFFVLYLVLVAACSADTPPATFPTDTQPAATEPEESNPAPEATTTISADDLEYLVWESCRQIRGEGMTPNLIAALLQDAARHGAVIDEIQKECGAEIEAAFNSEP